MFFKTTFWDITTNMTMIILRKFEKAGCLYKGRSDGKLSKLEIELEHVCASYLHNSQKSRKVG